MRRWGAERLPSGLPSDPRPSWAKRLFGGFFQGWLQPRYVMGMAMTILSFSMLARFAHIEPRQLRPSDLDPVKVWQGIDDHSHRVYDRAMKYYDNLRLVIEIQSRLQRMDRSGSVAGRGRARRGAMPLRQRAKEVVSNELRKSSRGSGHRLLPGMRKAAVRNVPPPSRWNRLLRRACCPVGSLGLHGLPPATAAAACTARIAIALHGS